MFTLNNRNIVNPQKYKNGFTLIELLISSTIIIFCIISVVTMLRKGREIDINDRYRRLARTIVVSGFESPQFDFVNFEYLTTLAGSNPTVQTGVIIDSTGTQKTITGTLTTKIDNVNAKIFSGMAVPYIPVTISMAWQTSDGSDQITLTKFISPGGIRQ